MAEEHRCQAPEGHRLCANNCGFIGSPTTMNLCSKCYRDIRLKEQEEASTKSTIETALSSSSSSSQLLSTSPPTVVLIPSASISTATVTKGAASSGSVSAAVQPNRCASCSKRVGLTGFKCRCGVTFCGTHRYPEKHECSFDFKTVGREEIARANPVIKAAKLERI
ncbi:unnamed protein product [Lupinus luteus]|uniref:Uncharacterized protein n=1 Tax=Lupinus luteus TaxID=3873 RepID=A0AAV1X5N7_LUPLU